MLTYHGSEEAKAIRIERCKAHMTADRLRAGAYADTDGERFVACAIGCQVYDIALERGVDPIQLIDESDVHALVAEDYGWPEWLAHLEDRIFEGLPQAEKAGWPLRLAEAVPVGKDIDFVRHQIGSFILREVSLKSFDHVAFPAVAAAIERVAALHDAREPKESAAWDAAASAADAALSAASAAWSAALSAASAAWSAALSAAESAADSAADAAWSAARGAARGAADAARGAALSAAYQRIADALIGFLLEA